MPDMVIHIDNLGIPRPLGCIPTNEIRLSWPVFGESGTNTPKLIERREWKPMILELNNGLRGGPALDAAMHCPPVHDQDGVGQCNCDATAGMMESLRAVEGLPHVQLSAADLYNRINGGSDRGSLLEDALEEMTKTGIGTAASCGTLWRHGMPQASDEERSKYKVTESWLCPTFDHLMSATLYGYFGISGIWWYDNYSSVDSDGWLPEVRIGNPGGHAIEKILVADFRESGSQISYAIGHQNSWRPTWGRKGRMFLPESAYAQNQYGRVGGWWVGRVAVTEGGNVPTPKDA